MDFSVRYLKRREMFPIKIAKVEWSQQKRPHQSAPISDKNSPAQKNQRQLHTPFFTRKMNQFMKKNEVSQCLKIINMLKKLQCEEDLRKMSILSSNPVKNHKSLADGFPARTNWRLKSAKLNRQHQNNRQEQGGKLVSVIPPTRGRSATH